MTTTSKKNTTRKTSKKVTSKAASKSKASSSKSKAASKSKAVSKSKAASKAASKSKTASKSCPVEEVEEVVERPELPRLEATRESIVAWFDRVIEDVELEVVKLRKTKCQGGRFLKGLNKKIKSLKTKSVKVMGKKPARRTNTNSGFLKKVPISKEMAKFTGWDSSELKSRVDVTKHICQYIREKNLQNPADRRQILPDAKLTKLLSVKKGDPPLTYYRIQSCIKRHFA